MTALDPGTASTASDAELITAVRAGDKHAFGELYERHGAAAGAVARQYAPRPADADDVVSDAFAKVLSVLQSGGGPDVAFRAYLFTVVRHTAYGLAEGSRRQRPTDDWTMYESSFGLAASTEEPALEGFERSVVARAYRELPERWQAVLWYTEVESLTPAQIAPLLGLTANGVSALAYRAREGLRQAYLQQHLSGAPGEGCREVNGLLGSYVRGGLAKRETAQVETHLSGCGDCRALVLELGDVAHGMRGVVAPLVLGTGALALLGHALPLGGAVGGAGVAVGTGGAAAGSGVGTGVGVAASGAGATGGAAAAGAGGTATAGVSGLAAFFAAAPITATVVTVGLTAAVGLGVAAGLGAFSRGAPESAAPVVSGLLPLASPTVPSGDVVDAGIPDLTSPTTVDLGFPGVDATTSPTSPAPPTSAPTPPAAPTADPTAPPPLPAPASLALDLDSAPTFTVGSASQVSLTASNSGGTAAEDVDVTVQLPQAVDADGAALAPGGTGGTGGGVTSAVVRLDVPDGACTVDAAVDETSGPTVTCHLASLAPGAQVGVTVNLTPRSRSFGGFAWQISAQGYTAPWTGSWARQDPTVHSANLVPSASSDLTVANPGEGDVSFGLDNTGDAGVSPLATVALTVPDGVRVTGLTGGGTWTAVDGFGGTVWRVPDGFSLPSGGQATLTAHVVADGTGGESGTAPAAPDGQATLTVRGAVADGATPAASEALKVEDAWKGAEVGAPTLQCTGPGQVGQAVVTVPVSSGSVASTTAAVTGSTVADGSVPGPAPSSVGVPVTYASSGPQDLGVTFSRAVDGTVRTFTAPSTSYTADRCAPELSSASPASSVTLANPDTTTLDAAVTNDGSVAATGVTAKVQVPGSLTYTVNDGWTRTGTDDATGADVWTYGGSIAPGGTAPLPLAVTGASGAATAGSIGVTFAPGNPDPTVSDPTSTWTRSVVLEGPWTGATASAEGAMQCVGWQQPGEGTLTIDVGNDSVAAFTASANGASQKIVAGGGRLVDVPVSYLRQHGWDGAGRSGRHGGSASVDVTFSRDGQTTTRTVSYVQEPCPGKPVLDAAGGADATVANPDHVTVTASVTNDGTARARDVVARLDLPDGYTVRDVGGDFRDWGRSVVAAGSLAPGRSATLSLDLTVDVPRDAGATDEVGVTFDARRAASSGTTVQVTTEARWPVGATAVAQCDGTVTVTLTNGSSDDVQAEVPGAGAVLVPGNGSREVTVKAYRHHYQVRAGSLQATFSRDGFSTSVDASYDAPDCTHPAASVASVGDCTFDRGSQQSSAPVAVLLDNTKSAVPVWFRVSGGDGTLVRAGDTATVRRTVGEQGATFVVEAAGETFTLPVDAVRCVPAWHPGFYDDGDRVTYRGDVWRLDHGVLGQHRRLSWLAPPDANDVAHAFRLPAPWVRES